MGYGIALQSYSESDVTDVIYSVNNTVIKNNYIDLYAGIDGIYADRECDYSIIKYNTITFDQSWSDNSDDGFNNGIYFWKSGNNTVIGNTISHLGYGIRLRSSSNNTVKGNTLHNNGYALAFASSGYELVRQAYPATTNNYISFNNIYRDEYTSGYYYIIATDSNVSTANGDAIDATNNYWGDSITQYSDLESLLFKETDVLVIDLDPYLDNLVYKITFVSDASNVDSPDEDWFESGVAIGTMPTLTRTGYVFGGWYTTQNGTGTHYSSTTSMPESDVTLYAYWYVPVDDGTPAAPGNNVPVIIGGDSYNIGEVETKQDSDTGVQTTVVTVGESGFNQQSTMRPRVLHRRSHS